MGFAEVLFGIILTVFSARNHGVTTENDRVRLQGVAQDIWTAATQASVPLYQGEAAAEAAAVALATIAYHESGFWEKVQDCSVCYRGSKWCGGGLAITLFQLEGPVAMGSYTRTELCASNAKASERAMAVLSNYRRSASPVSLFDGYARGGASVPHSVPAQEMAQIYYVFLQKAGLRVAYASGGMRATWKEGTK